MRASIRSGANSRAALAKTATGAGAGEECGAERQETARVAADLSPEEAIRAKALELGFDAVGLASAELPPEIQLAYDGQRVIARLD